MYTVCWTEIYGETRWARCNSKDDIRTLIERENIPYDDDHEILIFTSEAEKHTISASAFFDWFEDDDHPLSYHDDGILLNVRVPGFPSHEFRLVDFVPGGYEIWNIGKQHMPKGYLPLCRIAAVQPFPGGRNIEEDTLCAIKIDGADKILDAVGAGINTPNKMETFLQRNANARPESWQYTQKQRIQEALPIMRRIRWH